MNFSAFIMYIFTMVNLKHVTRITTKSILIWWKNWKSYLYRSDNLRYSAFLHQECQYGLVILFLTHLRFWHYNPPFRWITFLWHALLGLNKNIRVTCIFLTYFIAYYPENMYFCFLSSFQFLFISNLVVFTCGNARHDSPLLVWALPYWNAIFFWSRGHSLIRLQIFLLVFLFGHVRIIIFSLLYYFVLFSDLIACLL